MFGINPQTDLYIIHGFVLIVALGVYYNLWTSTKLYGGLIGKAIRFIGIGMLFFTVAVIERILLNFQIVQDSVQVGMIQDIMNVVGLALLFYGYLKLAAATRG
jgi:hypothetical protein